MSAYNYSLNDFPEANQPIKRISWPQIIRICIYAGISIPVFFLQLFLYPFSRKPTGPLISAIAAAMRTFVSGLGTNGLVQKMVNFQPLENTMNFYKCYKGKNNYNTRFTEAKNSISRWVYEKEGRTKDDPVMLYIHGGGFETKASIGHIAHARTICEKCNISAIMIDYGTIPWFEFPTQLDECIDSYKALAKSCKKIIVAGDSAGGNLVAAVALKLKELKMPLWGLYAISPWVELYPKNTGSWETNLSLDWLNIPWLKNAAEQYTGHGKYDDNKLAQPCLATSEDWKGAMPKNSLIVYSKCELFYDQCAKLVETAGVTDSFCQERGIHVHNIAFDKQGPANELVYATIKKWKGL